MKKLRGTHIQNQNEAIETNQSMFAAGLITQDMDNQQKDMSMMFGSLDKSKYEPGGQYTFSSFKSGRNELKNTTKNQMDIQMQEIVEEAHDDEEAKPVSPSDDSSTPTLGMS